MVINFQMNIVDLFIQEKQKGLGRKQRQMLRRALVKFYVNIYFVIWKDIQTMDNDMIRTINDISFYKRRDFARLYGKGI